MSSIGPDLPPHLLAKRKREQEAEHPKQADVGEKGPGSPNGDKRRRVMGPAMPPAPLDELPQDAPEGDEDSSSDDGYGPALRPGEAASESYPAPSNSLGENSDNLRSRTQETKSGRDAWMMMPPKQDDLAARMDPSKQRARGFNAGKAGRPIASGGGGDNELWTETPEQKRKRLANEVLGISTPTNTTATVQTKKKMDEDTARRLKEQISNQRGKSLYEEHQKSKPQELEDDPSKRAFDREKDMAIGPKIGHTQRKEMLNRASDFNSKFSGGNFL